ncbi:hypothetical protein O181_091351 [Austropuccinia psidii MF-1]|uniref:Uncharacterized protein n=1 Tax=Austropuccinia psidii MF-1 TaxID=1389203 RepID=A0A9Q3IX97_9BASI|nr:hypothetical protein [Austropuccinia psidii MF-1]
MCIVYIVVLHFMIKEIQSSPLQKSSHSSLALGNSLKPRNTVSVPVKGPSKAALQFVGKPNPKPKKVTLVSSNTWDPWTIGD